VLALVNGAFSDRFADIARSVGRDVTTVDAAWGDVVPLERVEEALRARHYVAMTVVHSETSTGALMTLPELSEVARRYDTLTLVDSVTGLGGAPVETDAWGLDVVLTGSQKALALPPGLAFAVTSERFLEGAKMATARGRYFDVLEFEQYARKHQTPNTPALSLLYATLAQAEAIAVETIEARWARHAAMRAYTGEWIARVRDATGIPLATLAREGMGSPTVTGIALPPNIRGDDVVAAVAARGFVIGGGYGKLKPRSIRIGHMGDHTVDGLSRCLDAVEDSLREVARG
jgi:aspartate aminotransferase-like enzyme